MEEMAKTADKGLESWQEEKTGVQYLGVKLCGTYVGDGKACEDESHHSLRNGRAPKSQCKMGLTLWYCGIFSVPFPLLLAWNVLAHHIY